MSEYDAQKSPEAQEEVLKAIAAFEEILEAIPDDPASLEALSHAYDQAGDRNKAAEHLARLGVVLADSGETEWARDLLPRLAGYRSEYPAVAAAIARLEALTSGGAAADVAKSAKESASVAHGFSMQDALSFAWRLLEARELTDAEYAKVVQDLTEMPVSDGTVTTSVLHALEHGGFKGLERILNFVAQDCGTPVIALSCFEVHPEVSGLLPVSLMIGRGIVPFAVLGKDDVLAVVMNPYDRSIRDDVKVLTGKNCHCYLSLPSEFDQAISRIVGSAETSAKKTGAGKQ